jgi:hypothetical protein
MDSVRGDVPSPSWRVWARATLPQAVNTAATKIKLVKKTALFFIVETSVSDFIYDGILE